MQKETEINDTAIQIYELIVARGYAVFKPFRKSEAWSAYHNGVHIRIPRTEAKAAFKALVKVKLIKRESGSSRYEPMSPVEIVRAKQNGRS